MNKTIRFCYNWNNKLYNPIFTTIRNWTQEKWNYYNEQLGKTFAVIVNNLKIGEAILIEVERWKFNELPKGLLHIDTGIINNYEIEDLFKKFGVKEDVIILTFKRKI